MPSSSRSCLGITTCPLGPTRWVIPTSITLRARPTRPVGTSDEAEGDHRSGDALEAGDVGADHVVVGLPVLLGRLVARGVDALHDLAEAVLGVGERPGVAAGVLLHLERRGGDAAGVG